MISVRGHDALRAAVLAMKAADKDIRNDINRATRATMNPVWRSVVDAHATRHRDARIIAQGARIIPGNPPVAVAANSRRPLRGGLVPSEQWAPVEFGANREKVTTYQRRSPKGTMHQVTRHTARQLPPRRRAGWVAYPALAETIPRMLSLWAQLIIKKYAEAAEKVGRV